MKTLEERLNSRDIKSTTLEWEERIETFLDKHFIGNVVKMKVDAFPNLGVSKELVSKYCKIEFNISFIEEGNTKYIKIAPQTAFNASAFDETIP